MSQIDMVANETHFVDHLAPVWLALPVAARGSFIGRDGEARDRIRAYGITPIAGPKPGNPTLVASAGDLHYVARYNDRIAIMEHGSGQSYGGHSFSSRSASYAGGHGRQTASLFLHPNEAAAYRDRTKYPKARVEVVGSPFLDQLPAYEPGPEPIVAFTWHFDSPVCPETHPAFTYYRTGIIAAAAAHPVLGHAHPRWRGRLDRWYVEHGIPVAADVWDVLRHAAVLVADNTSLIFAFAATGRPVVVVNAPSYRRNINHGLRFWDAVGGPKGDGPARVGPMVDDVRQLPAAIERALADSPEDRAARERAVHLAYGYRTGAAKRAAKVLREWAA